MRLLALSIGIALLCTTGAEAQDDAAGRARRLFELGVAAMDRRQPGEAAQHFDESYRLFPRASTACNMALAQEQLGQPCAARRWYEQCAAIDPEGDKREHANAQIARLAPLCSGAETPVHDPFVRAPSGAPALTGSVQVVEAGAPAPMPPPSRDRTLLGFGIAGLVLGVGAIGGGAGAALEAQAAVGQLPPAPAGLMAGSPEAALYERAALFSDVALGLYIGGSVLAGLGLVALVLDLAQPDTAGPNARGEGPRLVLAPTLGGGFAGLTLAF